MSDSFFEGPNFSDDDDLDEDEEFEDEEFEDENAVPVAGSPDDAGNRLMGGTARAVLEHVARSIAEDPDSVVIEVSEGRGGLRLSLHVAQSDMGRIIGRRGRVAQALRTLVRAAAARDGTEASVDIVD